MKKPYLPFFLLIGIFGLQSQIKAPVLREISFNILIKNVDGKKYYTRIKDNHIFNNTYEILIKKRDSDYTSTNNLTGIFTGLKEKGNFIKGYKNGIWKTFYKKQHVKTENWHNGLIIGKYKVYNTEGKLLYQTNFGKKGTGLYKDFFYKKNTVKQEGYYENGKKEGEWCFYNKHGIAKEIVFFKKGMPIKN